LRQVTEFSIGCPFGSGAELACCRVASAALMARNEAVATSGLGRKASPPTRVQCELVSGPVSLEVSNIAKVFTDAQGGRSYQIGTRNAQTALRLRDGETQILGGLISDQDQRTVDKLPGLGQTPVIGALFSNNSGTRSKTEIVLSITPHIIRGPAVTESALRDVFSGTESSVRERALRLDPVGDFRVPAATTPTNSPAPVSRPASESPAPAAPAAPAPTSVAPTAPGVAAVPASASATPAMPPTVGDLSWSGPTSARVGESFQGSLTASAMPATGALPLTVRFDPVVLSFVSATLGSLAQDAGASDPAPKVDGVKGRLDIPMSFSKPAALGGSGSLLTLTFNVKAGRPSTQLIASQMAVKTETGADVMLPASPRSHSVMLTK